MGSVITILIIESVEDMNSVNSVSDPETGSLLGGSCLSKLVEIRDRVFQE